MRQITTAQTALARVPAKMERVATRVLLELELALVPQITMAQTVATRAPATKEPAIKGASAMARALVRPILPCRTALIVRQTTTVKTALELVLAWLTKAFVIPVASEMARAAALLGLMGAIARPALLDTLEIRAWRVRIVHKELATME